MLRSVFVWYEAVCTGLVSGYGLAAAGFGIYACLRLAIKGDD